MKTLTKILAVTLSTTMLVPWGSLDAMAGPTPQYSTASQTPDNSFSPIDPNNIPNLITTIRQQAQAIGGSVVYDRVAHQTILLDANGNPVAPINPAAGISARVNQALPPITDPSNSAGMKAAQDEMNGALGFGNGTNPPGNDNDDAQLEIRGGLMKGFTGLPSTPDSSAPQPTATATKKMTDQDFYDMLVDEYGVSPTDAVKTAFDVTKQAAISAMATMDAAMSGGTLDLESATDEIASTMQTDTTPNASQINGISTQVPKPITANASDSLYQELAEGNLITGLLASANKLLHPNTQTAKILTMTCSDGSPVSQSVNLQQQASANTNQQAQNPYGYGYQNKEQQEAQEVTQMGSNLSSLSGPQYDPANPTAWKDSNGYSFTQTGTNSCVPVGTHGTTIYVGTTGQWSQKVDPNTGITWTRNVQYDDSGTIPVSIDPVGMARIASVAAAFGPEQEALTGLPAVAQAKAVFPGLPSGTQLLMGTSRPLPASLVNEENLQGVPINDYIYNPTTQQFIPIGYHVSKADNSWIQYDLSGNVLRSGNAAGTQMTIGSGPSNSKTNTYLNAAVTLSNGQTATIPELTPSKNNQYSGLFEDLNTGTYYKLGTNSQGTASFIPQAVVDLTTGKPLMVPGTTIPVSYVDNTSGSPVDYVQSSGQFGLGLVKAQQQVADPLNPNGPTVTATIGKDAFGDITNIYTANGNQFIQQTAGAAPVFFSGTKLLDPTNGTTGIYGVNGFGIPSLKEIDNAKLPDGTPLGTVTMNGFVGTASNGNVYNVTIQNGGAPTYTQIGGTFNVNGQNVAMNATSPKALTITSANHASALTLDETGNPLTYNGVPVSMNTRADGSTDYFVPGNNGGSLMGINQALPQPMVFAPAANQTSSTGQPTLPWNATPQPEYNYTQATKTTTNGQTTYTIPDTTTGQSITLIYNANGSCAGGSCLDGTFPSHVTFTYN